MENFLPGKVGCGKRAEGWTAGSCKRRFLLPALDSPGNGNIRIIKEPFYFGGTHVPRYHRDLLGLHGPDSRGVAGPSGLSEQPALWMWEEVSGGRYLPRKASMQRISTICGELGGSAAVPLSCRAEANESGAADPFGEGGRSGARRGCAGRCSKLGVAACEQGNWRAGRCVGLGAAQPRPPGPCSHPACMRLEKNQASVVEQFRECSWNDHLERTTGEEHTHCIRSVLPWAYEGELNASVADFTPNYLCDAQAVKRIYRAVPDPSLLRFVVVMRDPIMRAFSEWSMFSLGWNWCGSPGSGSRGEWCEGPGSGSREEAKGAVRSLGWDMPQGSAPGMRSRDALQGSRDALQGSAPGIR